MTSYPDRMIFGVVLILFCAGSTVRAQNSDDAMSDLLVVLNYYDDGQPKTELFATHALPQPGGGIRATGVVVNSFTQSGKTEMTIKAEDCEYNQTEQTATSSAKVSMVKEEMKITGTGFVWNGEKELLKLLKNVRVELSSAVISKERNADRD